MYCQTELIHHLSTVILMGKISDNIDEILTFIYRGQPIFISLFLSIVLKGSGYSVHRVKSIDFPKTEKFASFSKKKKKAFSRSNIYKLKFHIPLARMIVILDILV